MEENLEIRYSVFRFGRWQVDRARNLLQDGTLQRQMEPRAMDVLVQLCGKAGQVLSAEELLEQCWGSTVFGDNPIHKTITQLRRLLGDSATNPTYIETIRKRGYRTLATVSLASLADDTSSGSWHEGSPFRGLAPFAEQHAAIFCGRADATLKLVHAACQQTQAGCGLVLVLGPSGSGKTSLIRAGLLPHLSKGSDGLTVTASASLDLGEPAVGQLFTDLGATLLDWEVADCLLFGGHSAHTLGQVLAEGDTVSLIEELENALASLPAGHRLALFLDRFEAIFSATHVTELERRKLVSTLALMATSPRLLLILACRNDFYPQIAAYPALLEGKERGGHFDLAPPTQTEIAQIVRLPAISAKLSFGIDPISKARLDDLLCHSVTGSPDALPLLQYTLHELYLQRSPLGELRIEVFKNLGGVDGAIGHRAEEVFLGLSREQQAALPHVLSLLVTVTGHEEAVTSRRAPWERLQSAAERELVNALVDTRLFVSDLVADASSFGIVHEALLRRWPRAATWISDHRQALHVLGRIAVHTQRWVTAGRRPDLLLPQGMPLNEANSLLKLDAFSLTSDEKALIHASSSKARWRVRLRLGVMTMIVGLALLSTILGISAISAKTVAQQRRAQAEGLMGFMLGDFADKLRPLGRLDLLDSVSAKALEYLAVPEGDELNMTSLTQRAKALQVIAEVHIARGKSAAATDALLAARTILLQQFALMPTDGEVLKNLGANAFWLGKIQLDQSNLSTAEQHFRQYLHYSDLLHQLDPENPDAWIEQSYGHTNLGSLALKRGDAAAAALEFQSSIALKTRAAARRPQDRTLAAELANSLSWLASAKESLGELNEAMIIYERELEVVRSLHQATPGDSLWASRLALALQHRAQLNMVLGRNMLVLEDLSQAEQLLMAVIAREPSHKVWQGQLAFVQLNRLRFERLLGPSQARAAIAPLRQLHAQATALTRIDPRNNEWSRLEAMSTQSIAGTLLQLGRAREALPVIKEALDRLNALYQLNQADKTSRNILAASLMLAAEIDLANHDLQAAALKCDKVGELLADEIDHSEDYRLLDPWIRSKICLEQYDVAEKMKSRLTRMGYQDKSYITYLSTHEPRRQ
ncbi:MAG: winged helix-turn-helix domain-containing protein [Burkholderiales bacterium]|nr:winged helix-turn-helix domain-containing protein [Burkholderiales bacterium]